MKGVTAALDGVRQPTEPGLYDGQPPEGVLTSPLCNESRIMKKLWISFFSASLALGFVYGAEVFEVVQKDKAFSVKHLVVHQGDRVQFPNQDDVYHNVYSLSEAKTFDLGTYGKGPGKTVTFDQKGQVKVQCAIHPQMEMTIEVR